AGAELIGSDTVAAVTEVLRVALDALKAAGVTDITIDLTLPDLVETLSAGPLPLPKAEARAVRAMLDAKDAGGLAAAGATDYLPLLEACGPIATALPRLRALPVMAALESRIAGVEAIAAAIGGEATLTLDPTERHGFEYQTWIGFSLFGRGLAGEIGRGGSYTLVHNDEAEEPAVGFSLYLDPLVDIGLGVEPARRIFLPLGHDPAAAAALRREGWTTIAALDAGGQPDDCTHELIAGKPVEIAGRP
ncbi:ATP phosphoribosyltransferase regulatory subunit, partial [Sphingomonas bacterium]|uniref:ATP phosphoribosyltransferase regulatory subunit n=1 Tax=Sphingomonas bacterium TaxID=1895847 RepID=UPI0015767097